MPSYNKVILMGNLVRDPELRVTAGGLSICRFGLAVNRVYKDRNNERKEEVTFVDVDAFGKQAETLVKYLVKGNPLFMEGRLKLDTWETPQGEKRSRLGVVLESFQFIRVDGAGNGGSQQQQRPAARREEQRPSGSGKDYNLESGQVPDDDPDIPF